MALSFGIRRKKKPNTHSANVQNALNMIGDKPVVLIGLMGAGKTSVGRFLARRLALPFADADLEIEKAAGMSVSEIFEKHGEDYFRTGERRVIRRLMGEGAQILATGGGAFMCDQTRELIKKGGISVWLNADIDVLMRRVLRRDTRPLLQTEDPQAVMQALIDQRYPIYGEAKVMVKSRDVPHDVIVDEIVDAIGKLAEAKDLTSPDQK